MRAYFIKTDKGHLGPISIDLLRLLPIKRETLLWRNGTASWQKAEDTEDLKDYFKNTPPSLETGFNGAFKHSYLKTKVLGLLLARFSKLSLLISILATALIAGFLWLRFQPNKFGETEADKIYQYFNSQQLKYQAQQMAEQAEIRRQQEYERLHPEIREERERFKKGIKNPFENLGIVPIGPGASIPYEFVDGFWDYCGDADGKVFLNLNNIQSSFDSRSSYLKWRIFKVSGNLFLASFIILITCLTYYKMLKMNKLGEIRVA